MYSFVLFQLVLHTAACEDMEDYEGYMETVEETVEEAVEPVPAADIALTPPPVPFEPEAVTEKAELRFAEDILAPPKAKPGGKSRRSKKKGTQQKETAEDGIKLKKLRRMSKAVEAEDGEEY